LARRVEALAAEDAKPVPLPKGLGTLISEHFGVPPSKRLGDLRARLEAEVQAGTLEGQREPDYYLAWLEANRTALDL